MTSPEEHFREVAAAHDRVFWLDGGGGRAWSSRRSMIGWLDDDDVSLTFDALHHEVTRHAGGSSEVVGSDIFDVLEAEIAAGPADAQWVGYFGYACRTDLPARPAAGVPDAVWMRTTNLRTFDHEVDAVPGGAGKEAEPWWNWQAGARHERNQGGPASFPEPTVAPRDYEVAFAEVQEALRAGLTYELNLTYREAVESGVGPVAAYLRLRELNPAPYAGYLQHRGTHLLSSSPERYALVDRHRVLETKPIKGTTPRGSTPQEDERLRTHLATDPKFRAENLMITDLLRNDVGMVCEAGSVEVPALMEVESYASVHQLVSTVRGRLRDDLTTVAALRALFPAGSMTGAPKLQTMLVTDDVEETPRGVYAGAFGWIAADGRADLGVVIRSLVATPADAGWRYELGTGGGITVQSDCGEEYAETRWKAERLLRVLAD
ncbi:anthranilate synthase component I family protein [Nocardioides jiangxiensis]|uniref:Anthranilate synthase component I family protein n=1 Tax=Nocardioides jiangxiensis TaxID=3064524 RepID=A0ABT9B2F8_9ACTN|nr:anthranilate synthase component I family protein [Nocardioides sp. WY-20]MDO7868393.1 anthranilate synthase component I family protein [Nocardioides sp. WY-20]